MQHLIEKRGQYRFHTAEEGKVIRIEVYYDKGGANYFHGTTDGRGIYVSVTPAEVKDGCISIGLTDGIRAFIKALPRKSDKELLAMAERIDFAIPLAAGLAETVGVRDAIQLLLEAAKEPFAVQNRIIAERATEAKAS